VTAITTLVVALLANAVVAEPSLRASAYQMPMGLRLAEAATLATPAGAGSDTLKTPGEMTESWRALRTTSLIVAMNVVMTLFGRYIMEPDGSGFIVSTHTIENNLKNGFEWDDNSFSANNFRHPYQGAQYHGLARGNGYDFYEASLWAFFGSWLFEYTGEAHHPSYNDWINTAVGGIGLGEPLFRLQNIVLDNTATGSGRAWREIGGLFVHPLREVNRLLTGEAFKVHRNPEDRYPSDMTAELKFGTRTLGNRDIENGDTTKVFVSFDYLYGDPFAPVERPYDWFTFGVQGTFNNKPHGVARLQSRGVLGAMDIHKTEDVHHILNAVQMFDYIDNEAYKFGGQSVGATFLSRFRSAERFHAITSLNLFAILLGANQSDYFSISGREYDYGPGAGYSFRAIFGTKGRNILELGHAGFIVYSINGNNVTHYNNLTRIKLDIPIRAFFGVGADYVYYNTEGYYEDYPDVSRHHPELKLYASWFVD
jgi:hypothetical protein